MMDVPNVLRNLSAGAVMSGLSILWFSYLVNLAVYRLYLSSIARFPGPKLAALSKWYEFYYEVVKQGQFSFQIEKMHERYGPIVRITPDELHIQDSSFWDTLYARNPKSDKYAWMNGRFGNDTSIFTTSDQALHRVRRSALNPMFSKRAIGQFEPFVRQKVDYICERIAQYKNDGRVLAINKVWNAFAGDVITEYSFGFNYDHLASDNFDETFHSAFMAVSEFGHVALQFPWVTPLLNTLPDNVVQKMNPPLEKLLQLQRDLRKIIYRISQEQGMADKQSRQPTIFHEILQSDLPPAEKSFHRLGDEAQTIIGAGLTTTAWALTNAVFYILADTRIQDKLHAELCAAIPDLSLPNALAFQQLEALPYLRACIREGIRLSHGVSSRNPRVLSTSLSYDKWIIPPGTPISMTIADVHFDEKIYPKPKEFVPERWLDNPKAADGNSLDRYFVAFGKGPRLCLGINLAYMELFTALGAVFRRFRFELYDTDVSDVELAHDFFLPSPKLDSKGVRVKVIEVSK